MPALTLLVIADPASSYLAPLERLPTRTRVVISNQRERLFEAAPEADVLLQGDFHNSKVFFETFARAPRLRWVHVLTAGINRKLSPEIIASPVAMTNGRGVFSRPLAEWAIGAMIYFAYDLPRVRRNQRAGRWEPFSHEELHARTVAIVGYGDIGHAVGERAAAFGMRVAPIRRHHHPEELMGAIETADYVAVTAPLTAETRGLIGVRQIAAMKPTAVVINVARGPVVDEAALLEALESHKIRGAALDVFETEPLPADHPFYKMKNVLLSPHCAGSLPNSRELAVECFVDNFLRFANGEPLRNTVDKHAGY